MFRFYCVLLQQWQTFDGLIRLNLINGLKEINRNVSIMPGRELHALFESTSKHLNSKVILFNHVFYQHLTEYIFELSFDYFKASSAMQNLLRRQTVEMERGAFGTDKINKYTTIGLGTMFYNIVRHISVYAFQQMRRKRVRSHQWELRMGISKQSDCISHQLYSFLCFIFMLLKCPSSPHYAQISSKGKTKSTRDQQFFHYFKINLTFRTFQRLRVSFQFRRYSATPQHQLHISEIEKKCIQ